MIEMHSANEACAKCHERIDPFRFALENFDAIGTLSKRGRQWSPIDSNSILPDGTQSMESGGSSLTWSAVAKPISLGS